MSISADDFQIVQKFLLENSGISLAPGKEYLVEGRLQPLVYSEGFDDIHVLVVALNKNSESDLGKKVIEALTTNETSFFRDKHPFETLKTAIIPELLKKTQANKKIQIWSAASSSGQEPYSLCMLLRELGDVLAGWRVEIIGTDLSSDILTKAESGVYTQFEVQRGLPITMLVKSFKQDGDQWIIDSSIRSMVQYRQFNLLDSMASLGEFDMVFCRNVLIYFDNPTKGKVLEQMNTIMRPHAYLFLGGAETVIGITDKFKPVIGHRGIYELS